MRDKVKSDNQGEREKPELVMEKKYNTRSPGEYHQYFIFRYCICTSHKCVFLFLVPSLSSASDREPCCVTGESKIV